MSIIEQVRAARVALKHLLDAALMDPGVSVADKAQLIFSSGLHPSSINAKMKAVLTAGNLIPADCKLYTKNGALVASQISLSDLEAYPVQYVAALLGPTFTLVKFDGRTGSIRGRSPHGCRTHSDARRANVAQISEVVFEDTVTGG